MNSETPVRVAFFPDSFVEVNGVATTSRRLVRYAEERGLPLLCIHAGSETSVAYSGEVRTLSLKRSPASISMDEGLAFDPAFQRHCGRVMRELAEFRPDVLHITGLNDVSIAGSYAAWRLGIPMIGSWHTNLHEFAGRRLARSLGFLPAGARDGLQSLVERKIFDGAMLYYRMPKTIMAPNPEFVDMLGRRTRREVRLMGRGVDTILFSPDKRSKSDGRIRLGFVGRLRAEKNPRILAEIERLLLEAGMEGFEFLVVGEGTERAWLEKELRNACFTGFLEGEALARAYADMDIFIFPSETDTFGNVAQEAMASGVPVIVSDKGGPKFVIREGETGLVAADAGQFAEHILGLARDPERLRRMKADARAFALTRSWDSVFGALWHAYRDTAAKAKGERA